MGAPLTALVRIALRRPYTFVVLAILILLAGGMAALRTPVDIFPEIRIPVISVVWAYTGLPAEEMSGRIVTPFERALTTTVNDIQRIDANSYVGVGIVKVFFQPRVEISVANAQVTAIAQTMLRQLPQNTTPPLILNYNASTVPIVQVALSGKTMTEQQLFDLGVNTIRPQLITVPGLAMPWPFGGKVRQIQIDLDTAALQARGLSAQDVANALAAQNLVNPVGTQKIGSFEYTIQVNSSPNELKALGDLPIKSVNDAMVYIRDVAHVRDGNPPQTNIVHVDGTRSVILSVLKNGAVSTLAIIEGVKQRIAAAIPALPSELKINLVGDQSLFVRAAVQNVLHEGVLAATLTSIMILLFLGSLRSTLIITISIPLAVLASIAVLAAVGETLNIMTLGGLALAVGILVDEATVTIENINYHLEQGKDVEAAILDGADQIATPALVSMLCICIVFVPMFFLEGVARFLFVPMAEAVMFAMVASYVLSRTLVPTMAKYMLRAHRDHGTAVSSRNPFKVLQRHFEAAFERMRRGYQAALAEALEHRNAFILAAFAIVGASLALTPYLGRNFFPAVDGGQILMHARVQVGTRIEESARVFADIQRSIRALIPAEELATVTDNIGLSVSGINMSYNNTGTIGAQDGDVQIVLRKGHRPTEGYVDLLRTELARRHPGVQFAFLPADIVSQILNFGAPAPIDLQVRGPNVDANFEFANELLRKVRLVPGVADVRIQQARAAPAFSVTVDRSRAQALGVTERDVTSSVGASLAGTGQVAPTFWLNPVNGVNYLVAIQTPQYRVDTMSALNNLPVTAASGAPQQVLGAVSTVERAAYNAVVSQQDIQSLVQIFATTDRRDLGAVAADIGSIIEAMRGKLPKGSSVVMLGQVATMNKAYDGMLLGLIGSIVLVCHFDQESQGNVDFT
jgi:multidrug efflux pump subunit AcrB